MEVVFLAGRLGLDDDGWPLIPLLDRLERRRILSRVICLARGNAAGDDPRIIEFPSLSNRWLRGLTVRRLRLDGALDQARLVHVIHEEMADVGLALAEACQKPYLQTVDDFAALDHGLRFSKHWFRGLVVMSAALARELTASLGIPPELINVSAPGLEPVPEASPLAGWRVPVIGTAGAPREGSGFGCFLAAARKVIDSGRDAEFLVACQGDDRGEILRHARSLRIADRVSIADFAVVADRFWGVLDVFCQPSLTPCTGRLLILAMAAGLPCVASGVKGLGSLIDHGRSGVIVPPGDPEALAEALTRLIDQPESAILLGRRGRQDILDQTDPEVEADMLATLYRRYAASDPPAGEGGT